jgi:hypothetical protein
MDFSETSFFPLTGLYFKCLLSKAQVLFKRTFRGWPFFTMRKIKLTISKSKIYSKLPQELLKLTIDNAGLTGNKDME